MDSRAALARQHHRAAESARKESGQHLAQRDLLVRQLRAEDPKRWSYGKLAKAVSCSPELIRLIIKEQR